MQDADRFADRHIGSSPEEVHEMLRVVGFPTLDAMVDAAVPSQIRLAKPLSLPPAGSENEVLAELKEIFSKNAVCRSFIGMGYYDCIAPPVIQRNILENPRLVYAIHTVSSGDFPGTARCVVEFPDHGVRPDGYGDRQRVSSG